MNTPLVDVSINSLVLKVWKEESLRETATSLATIKNGQNGAEGNSTYKMTGEVLGRQPEGEDQTGRPKSDKMCRGQTCLACAVIKCVDHVSPTTITSKDWSDLIRDLSLMDNIQKKYRLKLNFCSTQMRVINGKHFKLSFFSLVL